MSDAKPRIELPPEAEPARDFIEKLVGRYEERIRDLEQQVLTLSEQVRKLTPRNSSRPPSTEHPHAKPKRKPIPKGKPRGGQPGHPRQQRTLVPPEQCTAIVDCPPDGCRRCGGELTLDHAAPLRHQVWELPPIEPQITEYRRLRGHCSCCGISTLGPLPPDVPRGQCGPRLAAFTGLLMGHFRQSKRRAAGFLTDLLNIPCSPAWTVRIQNLVADALAVPYEEVLNQLPCQERLFVDESPTREAGRKAWLWTAVARRFAVFGLFADRSRESLLTLIGRDSSAVVHCDRAKMYLDGRRLQWCWAHLKRDLRARIESPDRKVRRLGHDLERCRKRIFMHWERFRAGAIDRGELRERLAAERTEFEALLLRGRFSGHRKLHGFCTGLWNGRDHLWRFVDLDGIEPTNNTAERALRPAVIQRKLSFGTQSRSGSRFLERMLTVSETCRLQGRSLYRFLIEATTAAFAGRAAPALLAAS